MKFSLSILLLASLHVATALPPRAPNDHPNVKSYEVYRQRYEERQAAGNTDRFKSPHEEAWLRHTELHPFLNQISEAEHDIRKEIYSDRLDEIKKHNERLQAGEVHYKLDADHSFMHLTKEEFEARHTGLRLTESKFEQAKRTARAHKSLRNHGLRSENFPASLDWEAKGFVTPVKNQGECGSCWSFATNAVFESMYKINTRRTLILSEQELIDCNYSGDLDDDNSNHGCSGGMPDVAMDWCKSHYMVQSKYYPYVSGEPSNYNETTGFVEMCKTRVMQAPGMGFFKVTEVHDIINEAETASPDIEAQIIALLQNGPVTTGIYVGDDFMSYSGGVYTSDSCNYSPNHAVTIVGYGTDATSGMKFWKIKNSWDTYWGDAGYIFVERGTNMCNCELMISQPVLSILHEKRF